MTFDYEQLLLQLEELNSDASLLTNVPPKLRERFVKATRTTNIHLHTPSETIARTMLCQPTEQMVIRIAADMKLLSFLAADSKPKPIDSLAAATKADPVLMRRILRCLAANDTVYESKAGYTLNPTFSLLAEPTMSAAYGGCEDYLIRCYNALPKLLSNLGYVEPPDPDHTAVQYGYGQPGTPVMDLLKKDLPALQSLSVLMNIWQDGFTQLQSLYPVEEKIIAGYDASVSDVIFVDAGGNFGQKALALKAAFPSMPGKLVVQDLPEVIDMAPVPDPALNVEMMAHDFTTEQPVIGAKIYYIRQCLHNWLDKKCIRILTQLRKAMRPGYSRVIIHEIIMPETGAGLWPVTQDFESMCACANRERTEQEWRGLCEKSGLRVVEVHADEGASCEGLIVAETLR